MALKLDVIFPRAHHKMPTIPAALKEGEMWLHRRFCTMALNWSFSDFSTGRNYMVVNSRARCDTELLKDVQQASQTNWFWSWRRPQQPPHIRMFPPEENLATLPPLTKEARRVQGTEDLSEPGTFTPWYTRSGVCRGILGDGNFCTDEYPVAKARNEMQPIKSWAPS